MTGGGGDVVPEVMTRDEWIARLVSQAPDITAEQWAATMADLDALMVALGERRSPTRQEPG
jgi:hypothetical protein